jgi:L-alanine-DL-glutamate epimerase-like enolase superfamily enzyme
MNLTRRDMIGLTTALPAAAWLNNYHAFAAPAAKMVKISGIKAMGLDNVGDGCLIRIDTGSGLVGYGEAGIPAGAARERISMMLPQLIGQDPTAIGRHFYMMSATQYWLRSHLAKGETWWG